MTDGGLTRAAFVEKVSHVAGLPKKRAEIIVDTLFRSIAEALHQGENVELCGARPDLTVDGTIELERMDDVLFVGRPVFGQGESVVSLFRVKEDATFGRTPCANPRTRYPGRGAQSSRRPGRSSSCGWYHPHAARRSLPGGGSRALVAAARTTAA